MSEVLDVVLKETGIVEVIVLDVLVRKEADVEVPVVLNVLV